VICIINNAIPHCGIALREREREIAAIPLSCDSHWPILLQLERNDTICSEIIGKNTIK
jgi:hypothetical protein